MTVYGYIRVSTTRQAEKHSPEIQRREITQICLRQASMRVYKFLEDMGISGTRPFFDRPSLKKIYFDPGDTVVVARLDRLGRDMFDIMDVIKLFRDRGVRLLTGDWGEVTDDSIQSKILISVGALCADLERQKIAERIEATMCDLKDRGLYTGGFLPFGYYLVCDDKAKRPVEMPHRDDMIQRMRQLRREKMSYRQIPPVIAQEFQDMDGSPMKVSHMLVKRMCDV